MSSTTTAPRPFAHLHCQSQFSMLDGANRLPDLVAKVKAEGMNSVAITDHGICAGRLSSTVSARMRGSSRSSGTRRISLRGIAVIAGRRR